MKLHNIITHQVYIIKHFGKHCPLTVLYANADVLRFINVSDSKQFTVFLFLLEKGFTVNLLSTLLRQLY